MKKDLLNILSNSNKDIDNQQLMDYLSGNLSGEPLHDVERSMADNAFLNDAIEGLQRVNDKKDIQPYVDQLNASLQKSVTKKKERRIKRRFTESPWSYLAIGLIIALCIIAYVMIKKVLPH